MEKIAFWVVYFFQALLVVLSIVVKITALVILFFIVFIAWSIYGVYLYIIGNKYK
jgi:hypothetical protein